MKEKLGNITGLLIGLALSVIYIMGGIHSAKKHNEGSLAWWMPLWGVYRGIEQFWHDDYANTNWNEKINSDTKIIFYIIYSGIQKDRDELKYQKDVNQFRRQIDSYPKKKILILKKNASTYIAFLHSLDEDFANMLSGDTLFYKKNFMSNRTNRLMDSVATLSDTTVVNDYILGYEHAFGKEDTILYLPSGASRILASSMESSHALLQNIFDDIFHDLE